MSVLKEEKLRQLDKVLQSHALHGAESLKAFLRFVGLSAINHPETQLKEYVIATEVFGRRSDYDPRIDSAVRVQAGRLRTKLQEYYATEGKYDEVHIDLPKGQYTPVFSYAKPSRAEDTNGTHRLTETAESLASASVKQVALPLWEELLRAPEPVLVIFSNSVFHGNYDEMRLFNSLDVLEGHHDVPTSAPSLNLGPGQTPVIDHYTGIGEVMGVYFLGDFFAKMHHPFRIKRSLLLTWDDAKMENIVVLGSPAENLFLLDLPQKQELIFKWVPDENGKAVNAIVNTRLQSGEQEVYRATQYGNSPSQVSEDYATVSVLQGLSGKNRMMILAGINTFGTQAAAEYVTQPEYIKDLVSHLNIAPAGESPRLPTYFQLLLKVKVNGGVPIHISYVTHHVL